MGSGQVALADSGSPGGGAAARAPKLAVEGIGFAYGATTVLHHVDLEVAAGEFVSLLGPSGCGKTTLLRIVAGLLRPSRGTVRMDGRDITSAKPEKRPLTMVFQHLALFPHLSVRDNIAFGLRLAGVARPEIDRRVTAMLALVGLPGFEQRSVGQLSGGQRQRIALARSLVTEPEVLLLDEPLGALDLVIRRDMQRELLALQRRLGVTFVYVTHDQSEALTMSDRVVLMRDGRIVQQGSPVEIYRQPVDAFAANFVGETNLLVGQVEERGVVRVGGGALRVAAGPAPGTSVRLSVRPEHVALGPPGAGGALEGVVYLQTFVGPDVVYDVDTSIGRLRARTAAAGEHLLERTGEAVTLAIAPDDVRVFAE